MKPYPHSPHLGVVLKHVVNYELLRSLNILVLVQIRAKKTWIRLDIRFFVSHYCIKCIYLHPIMYRAFPSLYI
jgi:hypothetical protein